MSKRKIITTGLIVALLAEFFLIYIIYLNKNKITPVYNSDLQMWISALMNALSSISLFFAFLFIKKKQKRPHIIFIHIALFFSTLFLINYTLYHLSVGHVLFINLDFRTLYLIILSSHLVTSFIGLPAIFVTYALGISGHLESHKKVASYTFFIWQYLSITGVIIVFMLKFLNG